MFSKNAVPRIKNNFQTEMQKEILLRAEALEEAYKENPIVESANVSIEGNSIDVTVKLNFALKDDDQNIPGVLEAGGVIFDSENVMHEIEPGWYIRRIMANGNVDE
jgi:hypothetical protein